MTGKRYTFDVAMVATVYVVAGDEKEARARLDSFDGWDDLGSFNEHIAVGPCYVDDDGPELVDDDS